MNAQNVMQRDDNPHTVQRVPLHSEGGGVAVGPRQITGPLRFYKTVNSDRYVNDLLNTFFNQQIAEEIQYGYFCQDKVSAQLMQPWSHNGKCLKTK
jgi:hypothetical protein